MHQCLKGLSYITNNYAVFLVTFLIEIFYGSQFQ